ncbi:acyl-CoA binding domain-containing protein 6 [Kappamyces sp. JEL0829]|nr:acyl-CoA binding domain-containing protein 6 [Kappamyces sp. JEL0829]
MDFATAQEIVKAGSASLASETLLQFYALYKQAVVGKCSTPKPSFFDFEAKAKWEAWKQVGELSQSQAAAQYIRLAQSLEVSHTAKPNSDPTSNPQKEGFGVAVSTLPPIAKPT